MQENADQNNFVYGHFSGSDKDETPFSIGLNMSRISLIRNVAISVYNRITQQTNKNLSLKGG